MKRSTILKQQPSYPESCLPLHVERLSRLQPMGRAVSLAFLRWEKKSLERTERLRRDFGLHIVAGAPQRAVAHGTGSAPCIALVERGRADCFEGTAFATLDNTNLQPYVTEFGAHQLPSDQIPGGGRGDELNDPSDRPVCLVQGRKLAAPRGNLDSVTLHTNSPVSASRVNGTVRKLIEPAKVVSLSHVVLKTMDFHAMSDWYRRVLGLTPTDVKYLADGNPSLAFYRLDLEDMPADHHLLVLVGSIREKYQHSAYEVADIDAVGQGQHVLRALGWRHMRGIGRHLIESQMFDYWFDPEGFEYEHYADGDLLTREFETCYPPLEFGSILAWGNDRAQRFGKVCLDDLSAEPSRVRRACAAHSRGPHITYRLDRPFGASRRRICASRPGPCQSSRTATVIVKYSQSTFPCSASLPVHIHSK